MCRVVNIDLPAEPIYIPKTPGFKSPGKRGDRPISILGRDYEHNLSGYLWAVCGDDLREREGRRWEAARYGATSSPPGSH